MSDADYGEAQNVLTQIKAEIWDRTTMAEKDLVEHGNVGGERDRTWEMASGVRLFMLNQKVVVRSPNGGRNITSGELLRRRKGVNMGRVI